MKRKTITTTTTTKKQKNKKTQNNPAWMPHAAGGPALTHTLFQWYCQE
jgi:hypothetical protein